MKEKFPGFKKYMTMMRKRNAQIQENGFHWLLPRAHEYVHELMEEFANENDLGLRCWLLELISAAKSADALPLLSEQLRSGDWRLRNQAVSGLKSLNTKEAQTLLWNARSFEFASKAETDQFQSALDADVF